MYPIYESDFVVLRIIIAIVFTTDCGVEREY
jgi:hypothetical protein